MIIYTTKKTRERFHLGTIEQMPEYLKNFNSMILNQQKGDALMEWGAKILYFDRRKCLQVVNFASKFTLFLIDIKVNELTAVADFMFYYLNDLYKDDKLMLSCLDKMADEFPFATFSELTNKSIISTLNRTESNFAFNGYRFYEYIENGILKSREINRFINFDWIFTTKVDKKVEYFCSGKKFRELVVARYTNLKPDKSKYNF